MSKMRGFDGVSDVAVLEKGAIGLGNTGRNTTIIRSNYLWDASARIYEHSLKLWEGLSAELNFNLMLSQRGVLNLAHSESDIREGMRRAGANRLTAAGAGSTCCATRSPTTSSRATRSAKLRRNAAPPSDSARDPALPPAGRRHHRPWPASQLPV
jgi:glycine/D-amino acid oxidase-like deaminating enzyme